MVMETILLIVQQITGVKSHIMYIIELFNCPLKQLAILFEYISFNVVVFSLMYDSSPCLGKNSENIKLCKIYHHMISLLIFINYENEQINMYTQSDMLCIIQGDWHFIGIQKFYRILGIPCVHCFCLPGTFGQSG